MGEKSRSKLYDVKWNLVLMAIFCFGFSVLSYVTPAEGGLGVFMITPEDGLEGWLHLLPWMGIIFGALSIISSFVSRSTWVLSWTEVALGLVMFVAGFWELFFPYDITVYSTTMAIIGFFMAFYVMFTALEMDRKGAGLWLVELALAAVTWLVSFYNIMNFAGESATQGLTSLALFIAGWGFVYGAVRLSGVAPAQGDNVVCPCKRVKMQEALA